MPPLHNRTLQQQQLSGSLKQKQQRQQQQGQEPRPQPLQRGVARVTSLPLGPVAGEEAAVGVVLGQPLRSVEEQFAVGSQEVGRGRVAFVRVCVDRATGERYACKTIPKERLQVRRGAFCPAYIFPPLHCKVDIPWPSSSTPSSPSAVPLAV